MFARNLCLSYPVPLSAMKQTSDDLRFAGDFADALRPHVLVEREKGRSLKQIAVELGITETALKKCLTGRNTPCLRTVVLAFDKYRVSVPYSGVALFSGSLMGQRRRRKSVPLSQLTLPFEIEAPSPNDRLALKLLPKGVRRYQLQVTLRFAK